MSASRIIKSRVTRRSDFGDRTGVTIVVPCYNEEESIQRLKEALFECEERLLSTYNIDVILVDDGSIDDTLLELRTAFSDRPNYLIAQHLENSGIAAAISTGIQESNTEIVCSMDSDCTYDPNQLERMLPLMTEEVDLVTASPYHPDGAVENLPRWRLAISWLASFIYGCVMGLKVHTYTSCFRVYRRSAVCGFELKNDGFTGIPEMLWRVSRAGGVVKECPAILKAREQGQSKMRIVTVSIAHFRLLGRIMLDRCLRIGSAKPSRELQRAALSERQS